MRSALTHVIADALRAIAVMVVAVIGLCHSDLDMNVADAWVALVLSVLIIGGSGWSLVRSVHSWIHADDESKGECLNTPVSPRTATRT